MSSGPSVHPIEAESFRLLSERVDLGHLSPLERAVVARVVHATADLDFAAGLVVEESAVAAGIDALRAGAPVIADVEMVRAGITGVTARCYLDAVSRAAAQVTAGEPGLPTRSATAMRLAARHHPEGAVLVIGCAPTALVEVVRLARREARGECPFRPALVIGLPVGFVGAAEAKAELRDSGLPSISNMGEKGGSGAAAAAINALVRLAFP